MDKTKLKYQAVLFGNFTPLDTKPETTKKMLDLLSDFNMIPTTFTEIEVNNFGIQNKLNRLSFSDPETGFIITFGVKRIDFTQQIVNLEKNNIDEVTSFISKFIDLINKFEELFPILSQYERMAFLADYFVNTKDESTRDIIHSNLLSCIGNTIPKEWSVRLVDKNESSAISEEINNIITVERVQGKFITNTIEKEIDDIKLSFDIATNPRNNILRFKKEQVNNFFNECAEIHNNNLKNIDEKILKKDD